jgi:hypothetical protein
MMPGTTYGAVDDDAVDQRTVIVGAVCADGEDLVTVARKEDVFITDMPNQHVAFAKRGK